MRLKMADVYTPDTNDDGSVKIAYNNPSNLSYCSMKVPSCVLWQLTKHNSCFIVRQKGAKARNECFSNDPLNLTGQHNASSQGFTEDVAYGLSAEKGKSKKGAGFRKVFNLSVAHKQTTGRKTISKGASTVGSKVTTSALKRQANHAAKVINGLPFANDKKKQLLLRRLGKLNNALTETATKKE